MGLIAHYRLDGNALDSIGNYHGEASGGGWSPGKFGDAADFTGNNWYISGQGWPIIADFSFSFWAIRIDDGSSNMGGLVSTHAHSGSPVGLTTNFRSGTYTFRIATGNGETRPSYDVTLPETTFKWNHYAVTCKEGVVTLYQNGILVDSRWREIIHDPSRGFVIGRWATSYGSYYLNGMIDDVRIYDHALSPREVRDLSLGMVGHYPLLRDAINAAGYNSGSLHGSVVFSDEMGGSAEFDNSSYIQLETGITGDPDELSASFWAKTDTLVTYDGLLQFDGVSGGHNEGFVISVSSSTSMRFRYWSDGGTNTTWSAGDFATGKESHFCVTLKDNLFTIYQDGEKVGEQTYTKPLNLSGGVKLGLYSWQNNYFTGWIKDARIYATALTPAQVKELCQQRVSIDSEGSVHTPLVLQSPRARYIRDWTNGSTANSSNHWVEVRAVYAGENISLGKPVTASGSDTNLSKVSDGTTTISGYATVRGSGPTWVQVDLEEVREIDEVHVWHYYSGGRTYYGTKTEISEDGINWTTIFDSAVSGTYPETSSGVAHQAKALGPIGATPHGLRLPDVSEIGVARGLVAWYPLIGDTLDYAGTNHAVNNGAAATAEGYEFDGGEHLLTGFTPGESTLGQSFTWTWWDRPSRFASNTGSHGSAGSPRLYKQWVNATGSMRVAVGDSFWTAIPSNIIPLDEWSFFAVVFEEGEVRTYLNGQLQDTYSGVVFSGESSSAYSVGRGFNGERYYEGVSRDHRIYNVALTPEEVAIQAKLAPNPKTKSVMTRSCLYTKGQIKEVIA